MFLSRHLFGDPRFVSSNAMVQLQLDDSTLSRLAVLIVPVLGVSIFFAFIVWNLQGVTIWHGEPYLHFSKQLAAIAGIREAEDGGDIAAALLNLYHRYPKPVFDAIGTALGSVFGTLENEERHRLLLSLFQIACLLAILWCYLAMTTRRFGREIALLALLVFLSSQYVQIYAVFPRQNMTAHLFGTLALLWYLSERARETAIPPSRLLWIGVLSGLAVLTHYAALELIIIVAVIELVFVCIHRDPLPFLNRIFCFGAGFAATLFAADLVYFVLRAAAGETDVSAYPVLEGFVHTFARVHVDQAPAERLEQGNVFIGLSYLWQVANPIMIATIAVSAFILVADGPRSALHRLKANPLIIACVVCVVLYFVAASRFFTPARLLEQYTPALIVLFAASLATIRDSLSSRLKSNWYWSAFVMATAVLSVAVQLPSTVIAHQSVRGPDIVLRQLQSKGMSPEDLVYIEGRADYTLTALPVVRAADLCEQPDTALFYIHRSVKIPIERTSSELQSMRSVFADAEPIAEVINYNGTATYRYEFPLKSEWFDPADELSTHHLVYSASDIKPQACLEN